MLLACGVGIGICVCRRNADMETATKGQTATQLDGTNGSKHLNSYRPAVLGELPGNEGRSNLLHSPNSLSDYLHILQQKSIVEIRPYCQIII